MAKKKKEDLNEKLCDYCPLPEHAKGTHCYGGQPVMCEGSRCDDAFEEYLDSDEDEGDDE